MITGRPQEQPSTKDAESRLPWIAGAMVMFRNVIARGGVMPLWPADGKMRDLNPQASPRVRAMSINVQATPLITSTARPAGI
jgi:hypothetical protein